MCAAKPLKPARQRSKHSILIRRIFRHFHSHVPKLGYLISFKPKDVHDSDCRGTRCVLHARVNGNQILLSDRALHVELGIRKLRVRFRHACFQRLGVAFEIWIVMAKVFGDVGVSLVELA